MKKKSRQHLIQPTNKKPLLELMCKLAKTNPGAFLNPAVLEHNIALEFPGFKLKEKCFNCGSRVKAYIYELDYHMIVLLKAMGSEVHRRTAMGVNFTEANKVNVGKLTCDYTAKSKKTQMAKLGLITQLQDNAGKRVPSTWVVTKRGFIALANEPVPIRVPTFQNRILRNEIARDPDYYGETTTISAVLERLTKGEETYTPHSWYKDLGNVPAQESLLI